MQSREGNVSIAEAATLFDVSVSTLRRRLSRGDIPGAFRIRGKRGSEWRIPVASLRDLGYSAPSSDRGKPGDLEHAIRVLTDTLRMERARWEEWDRRLGGALAEIARLKAELRKALEENEALRASSEAGPDRVLHLDPDEAPRK